MTFIRIWKYARNYRKLLIVSLSALIFVVAIELTFPFIFKSIIDNHIIGIEKPWYEVTETVEGSVYYDGRYFAQERNIPKELRNNFVSQDNEKRVLLIRNTFYFVDEYVEEGSTKIEDQRLLITIGDREYQYTIERLSTSEVVSFYGPSVRPIALLITLHVVLSILAISFTYFYRYNFSKLGNTVTYDIRNDAFHKLQKMHISYYDQMPAGKVVARVTNDTQVIIDLFSRILIVFTQAAIYFVGIYISIFILDVTLATATLVLIPLFIVWGMYYRRGAKKNNTVIRSENSEINAYLNQSIKGMEIIQAFNHEDASYEEFQKHNKRYFKYKNKMLLLNASLSGNAVRSLHRLIYAIILLYFGWGVLGVHTVVSVGVIYAFINYMDRLINPVNQIFNNLEMFEQSMVSAGRVFYLLDQEETTLYNDHVQRFIGNVEFKHVNFAYENDNYVLKDINLKANSGETVALVGHTGSGKSSLMNIMLRFYDYKEGQIFIDGVDIRDYTKQAYRRHVGIVLQDPVLFTGTIASNISLNNPHITDEMIENALIQIGAKHFITKFSKGIHEPVLEMGSNFSTGERQLISFARAMIYDPAVLVLDEATANIDTETEQLIQKALSVVKRNRTTFIIAHRLSTVKDANQIVVLDKGRIIERGTHEELMKLEGKYYEMYQSQLHQV